MLPISGLVLESFYKNKKNSLEHYDYLFYHGNIRTIIAIIQLRLCVFMNERFLCRSSCVTNTILFRFLTFKLVIESVWYQLRDWECVMVCAWMFPQSLVRSKMRWAFQRWLNLDFTSGPLSSAVVGGMSAAFALGWVACVQYKRRKEACSPYFLALAFVIFSSMNCYPFASPPCHGVNSLWTETSMNSEQNKHFLL